MAAPSPPPPYEEVHTHRESTPRRVDATTPILAVYTPAPDGQPLPHSTRRSDQDQVQQNPAFSLQKFVFVWLGIGKWYSGMCLLFYMVFFGWGIAIIIMTATVNNFTACQPLIPAKTLSLVGGALFVVLGGFWVCAFAWKRRSCGSCGTRERERNFTVLGCFIWVLSMLFFSTAAALGVVVYDHQELILRGYCSPSATLESEYCPPGCTQNKADYFNLIPLVVAASIAFVFLGFLFCNILCWCCIRKEVGRVCC